MDYDEMLRDETLKLAMLAGAFAIRNNKKYNKYLLLVQSGRYQESKTL